MSIFGKDYRISDRGEYVKETPLKKIIKTTLGVSFATAVAYYSFKHGVPLAHSYLTQASEYKDALSLDASERLTYFFATLAMTPIVSSGVMIIAGVTSSSITSKPVKSSVCAISLVGSALALNAFSLHFDPNWSQTLINGFSLIKDYGLVATVGAGSLVAMLSPLFGGKIADKFEDILRKFPKFKSMTEEFGKYMENKNNQKALNQEKKYLEKDNHEFNLYSSYQSIRKTLEHHFNENHLNSLDIFYSLNDLYKQSEYILEKGQLEHQFEAKKIFKTTLAHAVLTYSKGLHRADRDIQLERTQELNKNFLDAKIHLQTVFTLAQEEEKAQNTMDFDVALTKTENQFNIKKLNHF